MPDGNNDSEFLGTLEPLDRLSYRLATIEAPDELEDVIDEIEIQLANPALSGEERQKLSVMYTKALVRAGEVTKATKIVGLMLEELCSEEQQEVADLFLLFLEGTDRDDLAQFNIELLRFDQSITTRAGILFETLRLGNSTELRESTVDWKKHVDEFYEVLGVCVVQDSLKIFRALYERYKDDRTSIERAEENGRRPPPSDLETAYWRARLQEMGPPSLPEGWRDDLYEE